MEGDQGLVINGERKREQEETRGGIYRSERSYGSFRRTVPIPDDVHIDQAKATFENGVLTVNVPVPQANQHRREIPIEANEGVSQSQTTGQSQQPSTQGQTAKTKAA